jgi:hypothetical protein
MRENRCIVVARPRAGGQLVGFPARILAEATADAGTDVDEHTTRIVRLMIARAGRAARGT